MVVEVRASSINPGEAAIRSGALAAVFPATFPSGEGSDLAGVVTAVGDQVTGIDVGDEVLGWSDERAAHATHVAVPASQVVAKPAGLSFDVAGSLYVAGAAAVASVESVDPQAGETVVVSGVTGGVGVITAQLLQRRGVEVVGIASERNGDWLRTLGVTPVAYGADAVETLARIRAAVPDKVHAWIDLFGGGYVAQAIELGIPADRINTIIDHAAVEEYGVRARRHGRRGERGEPRVPGRRSRRTATWRSRSRPPTRWTGSATRSPRWSSGTPAARSSCTRRTEQAQAGREAVPAAGRAGGERLRQVGGQPHLCPPSGAVRRDDDVRGQLGERLRRSAR